MDGAAFLDLCEKIGIDFYTGVPDSQLKGLCDTLYNRYGTEGTRHIVAANEGNAVGLAAGHYLATGHPALVYMQNSGLGNAVNPLASLMDERVYSLPALLVIGWRGEPGVHDEPQHARQGEITLGQLELLEIPYFLLSADDTPKTVEGMLQEAAHWLEQGRMAAIVVRKNGLTCSEGARYRHEAAMTREQALAIVAEAAGEEAVLVSTTGKLSRELFELRESRGTGHGQDFLTVGSMGHASSIALGIALSRPEKTVWCLDGDGAALMHLGAMSVIAQKQPKNLRHVVFNNAAHESVGGMPVNNGNFRPADSAVACGYPYVSIAGNEEELKAALKEMPREGLCFLEVDCALGARADLGRPTTTPRENRDAFMKFLQEKEQ